MESVKMAMAILGVLFALAAICAFGFRLLKPSSYRAAMLFEFSCYPLALAECALLMVLYNVRQAVFWAAAALFVGVAFAIGNKAVRWIRRK